ncbi:MAG: hypothetical protein EBZ49_01490 [Proteobacteria bacterium]|nr:hypothetical protein [Pseudomonadota bacterium]
MTAMTRITESQLRSLIREGISEVKTEMYSRNLSRRLNLKIAERKLVHLQNLINEATVILGDSRLNEGWFDDIKRKIKDKASEFKGGPSAAVSTLGRTFIPGYSKEGGLKASDLEKISKTTKPVENLLKKIDPALKRLRDTKVGDLAEGLGLIALDGYIGTVTDALRAFEDLTAMYEENPELVDSDSYLSAAAKIQESFEQAKEIITILQKHIQQASIDLKMKPSPVRGEAGKYVSGDKFKGLGR